MKTVLGEALRPKFIGLKRNYLAILIGMQLMAFTTNQFIASYFNITVLEMISYKTQDGHCDDLNRTGIGEHCFGDFYYGFLFANSDNPYLTEYFNAYPPLALFLLKPFIYLNDFAPRSLFAIGLYLATNLVCVIIAITVLTKDLRLDTRLRVFSAALFGAPLIVSIDRGNNIVYVLFLLVLFLDSASRGRFANVILLGTMLTLLKPQMLLLCLVFLKRDTINVFFRYIAFSLPVFFTSFLLFPKSFPENITNWFQASGNYQAYSNTTIMPVNISLSNSLGIMKTFVEYLFSGDYEIYSFSMVSNMLLMFSLIALVVAKLLFVHQGNYNFAERSLLVVLLIILAPGTTFHYYYLLLVPFMRYCLNESDFKYTLGNFSEFKLTSKIRGIFLTLILLIIPCWGIPAKYLFPSITESDISIHWQIANIVSALLFFVILARGKKTVTYAKNM